MQRSIIEYCSDHQGYKCGYCKKPDSNYSHGLWAHTLTVHDYQDLIDRGWRRSGQYCYKPMLDIICCPMYTIRCRALEFKVSKSQKKILKRFNKFLVGQDQEANIKTSGSDGNMAVDEYEAREQFVESTINHQNIDVTKVDIPFIDNIVETNSDDKLQDLVTNETETSQPVAEVPKQKKDSGPDPNKSPCKKAKLIRRERKLEKLKAKGIDVSTISFKNQNKEKQIEDLISELSDDVKRKLEIKLVRTAPPSQEWLRTSKETHEVYVKYQTTIHGDKPEKCTEGKFKEFLVQSPLLEEHSEVGPACGYGSFHQQYWLDGKLIAVGVVDILPKCVSSVYFFYDPAYRNLTLGTYGALREIELTRYLNTICSDLKYYYMGFYIHSCPKMRYKGNFSPSDLLCPETYKWFHIKDCIQKLEVARYSRFDPDIDSVDENYPTDNDVNYIPVYHNNQIMLYKVYKRKYGSRKTDNGEEIMEYARLVGASTAKRLVMVR